MLRDLALDLTEDDVLRGQGADPQALRRRRPALAQLAGRALELGRPLIAPAVAWRRLAVEELRHERLGLAGGEALHGTLLASHLGGARRLVALVCTIGPGVEERSAREAQDDTLLALEPWPEWDPKLIERAQVTMVVQVNGKLRDRIEVDSDIAASDAERLAVSAEKVQQWIDGQEIRKVIVREPNLVNIVVGG